MKFFDDRRYNIRVYIQQGIIDIHKIPNLSNLTIFNMYIIINLMHIYLFDDMFKVHF